jgi:hypothetical protein
MMQLVTQEFMVAAILAKDVKSNSEHYKLNGLASVSFAQACKQDVDRGVVHNILIHLFSKVVNESSITREDVYSIVGVANRAIVVDHRKMIRDKYQPLADFLELVGTTTNQKILREKLKSSMDCEEVALSVAAE